ncbi:hypothetical protein [Nonomuraea sp. NPDC048826]
MLPLQARTTDDVRLAAALDARVPGPVRASSFLDRGALRGP